jgi:hypothetical protein
MICGARRSLFGRRIGSAPSNSVLDTSPKVRRHPSPEKLKAGGKIQTTQSIHYIHAPKPWQTFGQIPRSDSDYRRSVYDWRKVADCKFVFNFPVTELAHGVGSVISMRFIG